MVRTLPLGRSVQPSSSNRSNLPVPVGVQVRVRGSSSADSLPALQQLDCMYVPFASTVAWASPMVCGNGPKPVKNGGGATGVQVLASGSKIAPCAVHVETNCV